MDPWHNLSGRSLRPLNLLDVIELDLLRYEWVCDTLVVEGLWTEIEKGPLFVVASMVSTHPFV